MQWPDFLIHVRHYVAIVSEIQFGHPRLDWAIIGRIYGHRWPRDLFTLPPLISAESVMASPEGVERALKRLETRGPLDDSDRKAVLDLPFVYRTLESSAYIVREGERPEMCALLLRGFAYRHKVTGDGQR